MLKAENLGTADTVEFHSMISVLFLFYGMEEMLNDAHTLSRDAFKSKWKQTLGDENTGRSSVARYKKMKDYHDEAKNRIFIAATENNLVRRLDQHMLDSAVSAQYTQASLAEAARFREKIKEILQREKEERHSSLQGRPLPAWTAPHYVPASSSAGPATESHASVPVTLRSHMESTMDQPWHTTTAESAPTPPWREERR